MPNEKFITSELNKREEAFDSSLRPQVFDEFPGQERVKERLRIVRKSKFYRLIAINRFE